MSFDPINAANEPAATYQAIFNQTLASEGVDPSEGLPGNPAALNPRGLAAVEQREGAGEDAEVVEGDPDMHFNLADVASADSQEAMEDIAGDEGILAQRFGWNEGVRNMFREEYAGQSREELQQLIRAEDGETQEAHGNRIQSNLVDSYLGRLSERVESRYAPGTISPADARAVAAQAMRRQLPNTANFQTTPAGERPTPENSTTAAINREINTIPRGSTDTDQPLYREAREQAESNFIERSRDMFHDIDRRYYRNNPQGDRRATQDARRFLHHRGLNTPGEIHRLLDQDPAVLQNQLSHASQEFRNNRNLTTALDRQMGTSAIDESRLTRRGRDQLNVQRDQQQFQTEERLAGQEFQRETTILQLRQQREEGARGRAHAAAMAGVNDHYASQQEARRFAFQVGQAFIQSGLQMVSQLQQQSFSYTQAMLQGTNQLLGRPADPTAWYNIGAGRRGGPA